MIQKISIPDGVDVAIEGFKVSVSGPKGKLEKDFWSPIFAKLIKIERQNNRILISSASEKRKIKAEVGGIAAHIRNMIKGVTEGFTCKLKIVYLHFPITAKVSGNQILISNFIGEKSPRVAEIVGDTKVDVKKDEIVLSGIDKYAVGQTAANLERATRIKRRDRRVFQDLIVITQKPK